MAEGDHLARCCQDARGKTVLERRGRLVREALEQPRLNGLGHDGERIEDRPRLGVEPRRAGEDGIANRRRDLLILRRQDLEDVEGVSSRPPVELPAVHPGVLGQAGDGLTREPRDLQAPRGRGTPSHLTDQSLEAVEALELLVAIGEDDQRGDLLDPPGEEPEDIQRRLVRPLGVLEDEDGSDSPVELLDQCGGDVMGLGALLDQPCQIPAADPGHVQQRPQRPRDEERIAASPEDPDAGAELVAETAKKGGLAGARLPRHEHQPPAAARLDLCELLTQHGQVPIALEQIPCRDGGGGGCRHRWMIHGPARRCNPPGAPPGVNDSHSLRD